MATKKISELTDATTVNSADEFAIVQSGVTKRATASEVRTFIGSSTPQINKLTSVFLGVRGSVLGTTAGGFADFLFVCPIFVQKGGIATRIGIEVTGAAAGNARLGIYNNDSSRNLPGTLVLDAGTVSVSSTGQKEITISQSLSDNTWYWLVVVANVASSYRSVNDGASIVGYQSPSSVLVGVFRAFTYAALPADESAQTYTYTNSTPFANMWVRIV